MTISIRRPESIHQAWGEIQDGTFHGRWHFSFDDLALGDQQPQGYAHEVHPDVVPANRPEPCTIGRADESEDLRENQQISASGLQYSQGALPIRSQARVFSCFLQSGQAVSHQLEADWGAYFYLLEGGPVKVDGQAVAVYGSAMIRDQSGIEIIAGGDSEMILIEVEL